MKRILLITAGILMLSGLAFGQTLDIDGMVLSTQEGDWQLRGNRLLQADEMAPRAKINMRMPQAGEMEYSFDVRYVGGAEDLHAAFGAHIYMDRPASEAKSWGNGDSYLLWLTYDPTAYGGSGAYAQVYKSTSSVDMRLHEYAGIPFHIEIPASYLTGVTMDNLDEIVLPVRIRVNANGNISVKDPVEPGLWWAFTVGEALTNGAWVGLRTSSAALSFGNAGVTVP